MTTHSPGGELALTAQHREQIFLSHASHDLALADWLASVVEALGAAVYMAERDPQPGKRLDAKITEAVGRSTAMLVLLTPHAAASGYVQQEIGAATQAGIQVAVLLADGSEYVPAMQDGVEYLTFDPHDLAASAAPIVASVRRLIGGHARGEHDGDTGAATGLHAQFAAQLQLTGGQLLVGLVVMALVIGLLVAATRDAGES